MSLTQINKAGLDEIALDHVFTIGASGSSAYTFQGEGLNGTVNNPTLYLTRGKTYRFENGSGGHPIRIQSTSGASGTAYNTGVTNNAGSGTVIVEVQHDAPDVLYYQCTSHAAMNGILYITGALADGGVTTAKIADDAVTTDKIADQAVTLAKLPHGTSSNDGKFLRANNGADPTFETVTSTTINNNADNRVITGSGTANTLNAESNVVIDSIGQVSVGGSTTAFDTTGSLNGLQGYYETDSGIATIGSYSSGGSTVLNFHTNSGGGASAERMRLDSSGNVGIGTTSPNQLLEVANSSGGATISISTDEQPGSIASKKYNNLDFTGYNNIVMARIQSWDESSSTGQGFLTFHTHLHNTGLQEHLRIMNDGKIGIGTTSPQVKLDTTGTGVIGRFKSTNNRYVLSLQGNNASQQSFIGTTSSGDMTFATGSGVSERIRIREGGGLTFNGDTAAANALDDYEEGTFTPSLTAGFAYAGNITYQHQIGHYTKIGNQVFAYVYLQPNGNSAHSGNLITDANPLTVSGLPFTSNSTSGHEGGGYITYINGTFGTGGAEMHAMPWVGSNNNTVIFPTPADGHNLRGNETNLTNKYLIFHVRYKAA